jgi:hypothetical protein
MMTGAADIRDCGAIRVATHASAGFNMPLSATDVAVACSHPCVPGSASLQQPMISGEMW